MFAGIYNVVKSAPMSSRKKTVISWFFKSLLIFTFLIVVVVVFTPKLVNLALVKQNIKEIVSNNLGGRISYSHLKLSYFPRPHVLIHKADLELPDSLTIVIRWMKIYPKILPLFRGSLQFDLVRLDYADFVVKLPSLNEARTRQPELLPSYDEMIRSLTAAVRGLPRFMLPDLNLRLKNGKVDLVDPLGRKFKLREVQTVYERSNEKLDFSIKCKSNLWEQIHINGSLNPSNFKGVGRVQLSRFRPQVLIAYLWPDSTWQISDSKANMRIDLESDGAGTVKAGVSGTVPILELRHGREKLHFKGSRIKCTFEVVEETTRATLTELNLDYPKLNMTGKFVYNENQQNIQLSVDGSQIDANAIRNTTLKLAGKYEFVQRLFDVIKGGQVPWIKVQIKGQTFADFGNSDNIVIRGRMTEGRIYIPGAELDLENVSGDAAIAEGILRGENLQARFGNSHGKDGTLILSFNDNLDPFYLDIGINADLSQLPSVLDTVVADKDFQSELARVEEFKGSATGRLILGNNLTSLSARVEVSEAQFSARYNRIPYPIKMIGGHFVYEDSRIALEKFNADIGNSSFLELSAIIDWAETASLKTNSKTAKIDLAEFYAWLVSFNAFRKNFVQITSLKGNISAQNLNIEGPMFSPQKWHFQIGGTLSKLLLTADNLPDELRIDRGQIAWQGTQVKFNKVDAAMGRSTASQVSGRLSWKKKLMISARSGRSTIYLEDIDPLLISYKNISKIHRRFWPLRGKLAFERMSYSGPISVFSEKQLSFSADVQQVELHSKGLPDPLIINSGLVSWRNKQFVLKNIHANMGQSSVSQLSTAVDTNRSTLFELDCKTANLFAGEIYPLLASFERLNGRIQDFSATDGLLILSDLKFKVPTQDLTKWHIDLKANMHKITVYSDALQDPVAIDSGNFVISTEILGTANRTRVDVKTTRLNWGDNHLTLQGQMSASEQESQLNMTINADGLDWDRINVLLKYIAKQKAKSGQSDPQSKLLGRIQVRSDRFSWDSYAVQPLEAEITFKPDKVLVAVNKADFCGISFQGLLTLAAQSMDIYFVPTAVNQQLASTLFCLTAKKDLATGSYSLDGEIMAKAKPATITRSLTGTLTFSAAKGRIYRFGLLAKILAILNLTEIFRGAVPDLTGEGFAYHKMTAGAKLQGSKLIMEECSIDGASMGIACEGDIDLVEKKIDLIILVAPFKTVDRIVDVLPLIGGVLGGKLMSIPFRAKGDLIDPEVYALPPTAVGSGILGILERTLKLPITIMQPIISGIKGGTPKLPSVAEDSPR